MNKWILSLTMLISSTVMAAEEAFDLNSNSQMPMPPTQKSSPASKFNLMGRVDLTSETTAVDKTKESQHELSNRHFLVFLSVKASDKTHFLGEIVGQNFYFVDHQLTQNLSFQFGKVIVPFGDTRKYHHIYGGLSQLKTSGIMFPNVWAESGLNFNYKWNANDETDLYLVNSIQDTSTNQDPDIKNSTDPRQNQAGGSRWSHQANGLNSILSVYRGEYQTGKEILIGGGDLYSDYGLWGAKYFRWALGIANAWIQKAPISGNMQKRGDYLELAYREAFQENDELRLRYGTYIDNSENKSQKDTHSFSLGYAFGFDVIKALVEYQWNFEEVSEKNNDIAKAMISLDF